jgi:hypothetical protein
MVPLLIKDLICSGILANRSGSIPDFETLWFWAATGSENMVSKVSAAILRFFQKMILRIFSAEEDDAERPASAARTGH